MTTTPFAASLRRVAVLLAAVLFVPPLVAGCDTLTGLDNDGGFVADGAVRDGAGTNDAQIRPNDRQLPVGLVQFAGAGGAVELDVTAAQQQFLVVAYSTSRAVSEGIGFSLEVEAAEGSTGSSEAKLTEPGGRYRSLRERDPRRWRLVQQQQRAERWTRRLRERAATMPMVAPPGDRFIQGAGCQTSADCGASEVCLTADQTCSETVQLSTAAFSGNATALEARVMEKGQRVAILVDASIASQVSTEALSELRQAFDEKIYPRDVALFGNPPLRAGSSTLASDRNADGLVWLVLTPRVSDKQQAVGFFVATDFLVRGEGDGEDPSANEADILYAMPPGLGDTRLADVLPTMAHEFQHLLSFAQKVYQARVGGEAGAIEALWLDEGLSHLAEDLCGYGGGNITLLQEETIPVFSETSLIPPVDEQGRQIDSRAMRGLSLLFLRYLFERQGGVAYAADGAIVDQGGARWLASIPATSAQGRAAIDQTYGQFKVAFERWALTVALDGRGVTDSPLLRYDDLRTDPTPPGNIIGLRMGATFPDPADPGGDDLVLERPLEEELAAGSNDDAIPSTSAKYYLLTANPGTLRVGLTTDESDLFVAVVGLD